MTDWDNTEDKERDEDAAWRDLVAQFDTPVAAQQPVPWPDREDMQPQARETREAREADGLGGADGLSQADAAAGADGLRPADGLGGADGLYGELGTDANYRRFGGPGADGAPDGFGGGRRPGAHDPDLTLVPRVIRGPAAGGTPARGTRPDNDEEHFIPPAPPPLPRLDPLTKGAWAALFGGPGYLVVATAAGWSVPGLAAFFAVAAFVAGFAILVLRMSDPGPGGPDDGDDGAVV